MTSWTMALLLGWAGTVYASDMVWIDVGSQEEYAAEHLVDAQHIPHTHIARGVTARYPDKQTPIRLYDRNDHQAQRAAEALQILGYSQVTDSGDLEQLKARGLQTRRREPLLDTIGPAQPLPALVYDSVQEPLHNTPAWPGL